MVAGHEHQRHVEHVHQAAEVIEGQVTTGDDELGIPDRMRVRQQGIVDLIGDGEDEDHMPMVRRGRRLMPGWMIYGIWPSVQLRTCARRPPRRARWMERSGTWWGCCAGPRLTGPERSSTWLPGLARSLTRPGGSIPSRPSGRPASRRGSARSRAPTW